MYRSILIRFHLQSLLQQFCCLIHLSMAAYLRKWNTSWERKTHYSLFKRTLIGLLYWFCKTHHKLMSFLRGISLRWFETPESVKITSWIISGLFLCRNWNIHCMLFIKLSVILYYTGSLPHNHPSIYVHNFKMIHNDKQSGMVST